MPFARYAAATAGLRATHGVLHHKTLELSVSKTLENTASSFIVLSPLVALHFYSLHCSKIALARRRRSAASRTAFVLARQAQNTHLAKALHSTAVQPLAAAKRTPRSAGAVPPPRATQPQHHAETRRADADAAAPFT